ncbi:MAG: hypothetical protein HY841_04510 [Bacteroidetes bacterium]|nr:hypothetical protein [Bacteroidota bacterium]
MLKKTVLRRQYLSKFDNLFKQTTYKKDSKKSDGLLRTSWTATQYLDCFSRLRGQLDCSPTDKKENTNPRFAFLKISYQPTASTFAFTPFLFFYGMGKSKRACFPTQDDQNIINFTTKIKSAVSAL